ncbi:hypothetical protein RIF29_39555 [Crotalaria pallida]|uniref:Ribosomal RNA-processing protein 42 n=1 Tax=Crotalaria pallida TaxID=3830 RepID=A0AAN9E1D8_CROPI
MLQPLRPLGHKGVFRIIQKYSAYNGVIQSVQVAVYEMKFGLSLVLSSTLEKEYLNNIGQENINLVMEMIYTLMRFPCAASCKFVSVKSDTGSDMHPSFRLDSGTDFYLLDMGLIEKLVTLSSGIATDKKLLHKIFDEFANLWMRMKVYAKTKSDYDTKQFMVVVHWGWQHDLSAWSLSLSFAFAVMVGLSLGEKHFIQGGIAQDIRCDGRKRLAYRPIYVETGVIPQANGSARIRMGNTDVIASVKAELGKLSLLLRESLYIY